MTIISFIFKLFVKFLWSLRPIPFSFFRENGEKQRQLKIIIENIFQAEYSIHIFNYTSPLFKGSGFKIQYGRGGCACKKAARYEYGTFHYKSVWQPPALHTRSG